MAFGLADSGRVQPRSRVFGANPEIDIKLETQIEKWAFFRENTHRNFNYAKPWNLIRGFFWLAIVPCAAMAMIMAGQRDGEVNNFIKPALMWPETSFQDLKEMDDEKAMKQNVPIRYTRLSPGRM